MGYKKFFGLFIITSISLMAVALYNGFPLVEQDTGAYIEQAIYPHFAADRTPFYGLFLRVTSLWTSLWFTVFAQCLILSYLILKYILQIQNSTRSLSGTEDIMVSRGKAEAGSPNSQFHIPSVMVSEAEPPNSKFDTTLLSVIVIISLTCVSWVASYLMPDIFTGIILLATYLYISNPQNKLQAHLPYLCIIFGAMLIHNSHFLILTILSTIMLVWAVAKKHTLLVKRSLVLLSICVTVWVALCGMNKIKKHGFTFSRGSDIFMMGKLVETGILEQYLNDNCDKKNISLCEYKNRLPLNTDEFLWSGESPLYKTGGWDSAHPDYKIIIHDVLTTPKYAGMFAQRSIINTIKELTEIQAPDKISVLGKDSEPWRKVHQYFADELREYNTSLQSTDALNTGSSNFVYYLFFILSSLWVLLFYSRVMDKSLAFTYCFILAFFVINAFVSATFSTIICRYQYRIFWILPATNAIIIINYYRNKFQVTNSKLPIT